jgi:hypothetical protein
MRRYTDKERRAARLVSQVILMQESDPQLSALQMVRWRLREQLQWYGYNKIVKKTLDDAIKVLDTAIAEVEVQQPKKEV